MSVIRLGLICVCFRFYFSLLLLTELKQTKQKLHFETFSACLRLLSLSLHIVYCPGSVLFMCLSVPVTSFVISFNCGVAEKEQASQPTLYKYI